jgi:hypothetical protein
MPILFAVHRTQLRAALPLPWMDSAAVQWFN